jgi:hypothetical protein
LAKTKLNSLQLSTIISIFQYTRGNEYMPTVDEVLDYMSNENIRYSILAKITREYFLMIFSVKLFFLK